MREDFVFCAYCVLQTSDLSRVSSQRDGNTQRKNTTLAHKIMPVRGAAYF